MSWLHAVAQRVMDALRAPRRERELEEEMTLHLETETARFVAAGKDLDTARALALARFGDPRLVAEEARLVRGDPLFTEGGMQDLRWAVRSLRATPGFSLLALLTLTLGVGASTAAFAVFDQVLIRPLPYADANRLVLVREKARDGFLMSTSYPNFEDWHRTVRSFSHVGAISYPLPQTVAVGSTIARALVGGVSGDFFRTLGVRPSLGRDFTEDESRLGGTPVVIASNQFWRTSMGERVPPVPMRVDQQMVRVVGVLPASFRFAEAASGADLYAPLEQSPGTVRGAHYLRVVARLAPGVSLQAARTDMSEMARRFAALYGNETNAADAEVTPLHDYLVGGYRSLLVAVLGGSLLVLLIACTNVVTAQLARGLERHREVAVRAALGASRFRLLRQLFAESAVMAVVGTGLGCGLGEALTRIVRLLGAGLVPRLDELRVDGGVLAFAVCVGGGVAMLIGMYPAMRLVRRDPGASLRGASRTPRASISTSIWRVLIGFEVAMAVVLVAASTLLLRTVENILASDTGLDVHGVVTAAIAPGETPFARLEQLRAELAAVPGVEDAALTSQFPFEWGAYSAPLTHPTDPLDHDWPAMAGLRAVTAGYFHVMRQAILRGRPFVRADAQGSPRVAIVTEGIVRRLWPGQDPIGKQVRTNFFPDQVMTVVGVAKEASSWASPKGSQNEIYVPLAQHPAEGRYQLIAMIRSRRSAPDVIPSVRARLAAIAPDLPAKVGLLEDRIVDTTASRRFATFAIVAFGSVALVLAAIGIYGVLAYSVTARRFEIGVRLALGATPGLVRRDVVGNAVAMTVFGIVAGAALAVVSLRVLASLLYGVTALSPLAYLAGAGLLMLAALVGAYVPAWRSSRVDPALAMRGEI